MQRCGPIDLAGVHVDARLEERTDASLVALLGGVGECRTCCREGGGGQAEPHQYESSNFSQVHVRLLCYTTRLLHNPIEEIVDFSGAVPERIQTNANAVEQSEVEVREVRSLLVLDMPATF